MSDSKVRFDNPTTVAPPHGRYSNVAIVSADAELLFIAGQLGVSLDGQMQQGVEAQYEQALRNVTAILDAHGLELSALVKLTTYLVQPLPVERIREIRSRILADAAPVATLLYVPMLGSSDRLVEVDAIAAR